jgi:cytochrome c oxidase cbb3-type subunit 3
MVLRGAALVMIAVSAGLCGCEVEKRKVGPSAPSSAPTSNADARSQTYKSNLYEQSEGGRMYRWLGCDSCHSETAPEPLRMASGRWVYGGSIPDLYRSIAQGRAGMPAYAGRVPSQQIWQLAGYVSSRPKLRPALRERQSDAQKGEPSGSSWSGPLP